MTQFDDVTNRLQDIVVIERKALVEGDFDTLAHLLDEKEELVEHLSSAPSTVAEIVPVRDGLRRNQELLTQTLQGLKNVAARIELMNKLRKSMDTYTAHGTRETVTHEESHVLERRA